MVLFQDSSWDFSKIDKWPIPIHKRCKCAIKTQGVAYNFLTSNQELRGHDKTWSEILRPTELIFDENNWSESWGWSFPCYRDFTKMCFISFTWRLHKERRILLCKRWTPLELFSRDLFSASPPLLLSSLASWSLWKLSNHVECLYLYLAWCLYLYLAWCFVSRWLVTHGLRWHIVWVFITGDIVLGALCGYIVVHIVGRLCASNTHTQCTHWVFITRRRKTDRWQRKESHTCMF